MKITNLGRIFPATASTDLGAGGGGIDGEDPNFPNNLGFPPSGQVPTASGSNTWSWGSNVAIITSNGSNQLMGPFVNLASGTNIFFAAASNTLTISSTGGGGGGGGAPTTAQYVVLQADGTLSAEKVRKDLFRYSPDNNPTTAVSVGHEYDDGGHGSFTWAPSDPTPNDVTTYPGFLKAGVSNTTRFYNKAWSPGSTDLTAAVAIELGSLVNGSHVGLYLAGATGNNPSEGILAQLNNYVSGTPTQLDCYTITGGGYSLFGSAQNLTAAVTPNPPRIYLRMTRLNSGPTWTIYWSFDGRNWQAYATTSNKSLTVAAIGLRCATDSGTATFAVPWIRGWTSILETIGS